VFHHPLIRAVAYESQLKSDRAEWHRRVAAVIQERAPESVEENAALIAEHLESAGELHAAYGWHMRAATWATHRDIVGARLSWERARRIADGLPAEDPNRPAMRIAPRTMLCGTAWRIVEHVASARYDELRELCTAAGDMASLAIGLAGLAVDHTYQARIAEGSRLASEVWALTESIGDPVLTVGLSLPMAYPKFESAEFVELLRWSQRVIDLADGDPSKGDFMVGSPLALALATRGIARYWLGRPGWREDLRDAVTTARNADPVSYGGVMAFVYFVAIPCGVLRPDDSAVSEIENALRIAERFGDDLAVANAQMALGVALVHRGADADRIQGQELLAEVCETFLRRGHNLGELPIAETYLAREWARRGDRDRAIPVMVAAIDQMVRRGQLVGWGVPATGVLVETLLDRGGDGDVADAQVAIEQLAAAPTDDRFAVRDIWLLRLRALLARAHGDDAAYRDLVNRYRALAESLGFEGHLDWAEAMA
jgi:hypothetical protein